MFSETYLIVNPSTDHPFIIGHRSNHTPHTNTPTSTAQTDSLSLGPPYSSSPSSPSPHRRTDSSKSVKCSPHHLR